MCDKGSGAGGELYRFFKWMRALLLSVGPKAFAAVAPASRSCASRPHVDLPIESLLQPTSTSQPAGHTHNSKSQSLCLMSLLVQSRLSFISLIDDGRRRLMGLEPSGTALTTTYRTLTTTLFLLASCDFVSAIPAHARRCVCLVRDSSRWQHAQQSREVGWRGPAVENVRYPLRADYSGCATLATPPIHTHLTPITHFLPGTS